MKKELKIDFSSSLAKKKKGKAPLNKLFSAQTFRITVIGY